MFPIVEKLGGWSEVASILAARGATYTEAARKKWQAADRRQLPRDVAVALAAEANARGIPFVEDDFRFRQEVQTAAE